MAMIGRKPFNPNAYVPPVDRASPPIPAPMTNSLAQLPTPAPISAPPKHNWMGILADALSGLAGQGPVYAPLAARRQDEQTAFERGEETWQKHHKQDLADQFSLLDYKRLHPDDQLSQYLDAAGVPQDQRPAIYRQKVDAMVAPPMMSAPGVDEQGNPVLRFFPRAQPAPQTIPALPPGAVPIGGATPRASGTFPRR